MPRRFAPRLFLTISQKVKIGGVDFLFLELQHTDFSLPATSLATILVDDNCENPVRTSKSPVCRVK